MENSFTTINLILTNIMDSNLIQYTSTNKFITSRFCSTFLAWRELIFIILLFVTLFCARKENTTNVISSHFYLLNCISICSTNNCHITFFHFYLISPTIEYKRFLNVHPTHPWQPHFQLFPSTKIKLRIKMSCKNKVSKAQVLILCVCRCLQMVCMFLGLQYGRMIGSSLLISSTMVSARPNTLWLVLPNARRPKTFQKDRTFQKAKAFIMWVKYFPNASLKDPIFNRNMIPSWHPQPPKLHIFSSTIVNDFFPSQLTLMHCCPILQNKL
jgi:hypothetical protein